MSDDEKGVSNNQSLEARKNLMDKDSFSFEKMFMTSRKVNEKQKPKIKNIKTKINNNNKYSNQSNITKRKNINIPKTSDKKETIKIEKKGEEIMKVLKRKEEELKSNIIKQEKAHEKEEVFLIK